MSASSTTQRRTETTAYEYMRRRYRELGDTRMAETRSGARHRADDPLPASYYAVRDRAMHRLGIGTTRDMRSVVTGLFLPSLRSPEYTPLEKVDLAREALHPALRTVERDVGDVPDRARAGTSAPDLLPPRTSRLHGSYTQSKAHLQQLAAPLKGFYTFERSAHSPMFEEPERTLAVLREDVLTEVPALRTRGERSRAALTPCPPAAGTLCAWVALLAPAGLRFVGGGGRMGGRASLVATDRPGHVGLRPREPVVEHGALLRGHDVLVLSGGGHVRARMSCQELGGVPAPMPTPPPSRSRPAPHFDVRSRRRLRREGTPPAVRHRRVLDRGGDVPPALDAWGESTVSWSTAPPTAPTPLGSSPRSPRGTWYEVDVTSVVTGDGPVSFASSERPPTRAAHAYLRGRRGDGPRKVAGDRVADPRHGGAHRVDLLALPTVRTWPERERDGRRVGRPRRRLPWTSTSTASSSARTRRHRTRSAGTLRRQPRARTRCRRSHAMRPRTPGRLRPSP